ncbi:probable DNA polymerase lambda at C-terminar half [Coccomyxa sp. Obi]|nr:probable DNA polymerase lambda at C-terminar half [Coccomyxa sp. Obi]
MQKSAGFLAGVKVYFLTSTISTASARSRIWERKLTSAGATVSKVLTDPGVTHVIVGDKPEGLQGFQAPKHVKIVESAWLEGCLSQQRRLSEEAHLFNVSAALARHTEEDVASGRRRSPMRKYEKWLGHWKPEYDSITSENELVLMVAYDENNDARIGNGHIVNALVEMEKYWNALQGDFVREEAEGDPSEPPSRTEHRVNDKSLSFARAASAVRACAYKIEAGARPSEMKLPFCGPARLQQICDIAATGTTLELEQHRAGEQVYSSPDPQTGQRRKYAGAIGSPSRRLFKKLPGVGSSTAKKWYDLGLRTLEDVEAAAKPGGPLSAGGEAPLSVAQAFSLAHRGDLMEDCTEPDIAEMRHEVLDALNTVAGNGWTMVTVGGAARGLASHDADFVVSTKNTRTEGVGNLLYDELVARGRLFPKEEAMCLTQSSRMPTHLPSMREDVLKRETASFFTLHNLSADRFDHIFGNYLTKAGKVRRMDVIIAPPAERAACILGWTGSRQYLRFLRQYAADRGMHLNSHRIMRRDGSRAIIVPDEGPPLDRDRVPRWPPGWGPGRTVETEADIFELLGLPYRPPHERNAP